MVTAKINTLSIQKQHCSRLEDVYSARFSLTIWGGGFQQDTETCTEVWVAYGVPDCLRGSHDAAFGNGADPHPAWSSWRVIDEGINWNDIPGSVNAEFRHECVSAIVEALTNNEL